MPQSLIIAIDFDDTFTADPRTWAAVIEVLRKAGHRVVCVTARKATDGNIEQLKSAFPPDMLVLFAYGHQKRDYAKSLGVDVDIWIDDFPEAIPSRRDLELMTMPMDVWTGDVLDPVNDVEA